MAVILLLSYFEVTNVVILFFLCYFCTHEIRETRIAWHERRHG